MFPNILINASSPPAIGNVTPAAGTFTTLASTGNATLGDAEATDTHSIKGATTLLANSASAALTVTQTGAGNAFVVEDSASTDSTPVVIDGSGRFLLGDTTARTYAGTSGTFQITGTASSTSSVFQGYWANDAFSGYHVFSKSRGAVGTHTAVQSGDDIGNIRFEASDGTGFIAAATIVAEVDGTPGTNDMPGRLVFSTTADGASSPTERMRIDSAGNVGIGDTPVTGYAFKVGKNATGATTAGSIFATAAVQSGVTSAYHAYRTYVGTQAAAFTLTSLNHYIALGGSAGEIGAGSTVTNQYGFNAASSLNGATNNYGFYSNIASAANRWNFYANGTAPNYFAGVTGIGITPAATSALTVAAGTTAVSSLNIPHGAAPTSPVNGDMWTTTAGLYIRINGSTVGPLS